MAKYIIDGDTLTGLANTLREVTGEDRTYTPAEMIEAVSTILDSATYILVDEDGNEIPAVFVENETVFDATANDIRLGKIAASSEGVVEGTKEIPSYNTTEGFEYIPAGSDIKIRMFSDKCEYTKLQAMVCAFNTTTNDSVATEKVSIEGKVYEVNSTDAIAEVVVDVENQAIDLSIINESDNPVVVRFFTYKEVY